MAPSPLPRLAAALALGLAAGGCRRPAAGTAAVSVADGPVSGRPSAVSAALPGRPGAEASFTADMAHPGMAPVIAKASETTPGRYEAVLVWTMPGEWRVFFEARWPDGSRAEGSARATVAAP